MLLFLRYRGEPYREKLLTCDGRFCARLMTAMSGTVIRVGDGRGFVVETETERYVVTAAHCLNRLPEPFGAMVERLGDLTFANILGPLGGSQNVTAECRFVDLANDLAVLGEPDGQELWKQVYAYRELVDSADPFPLGRLRFRQERIRLGEGRTISGPLKAASAARMLSLDGEWFDCRVTSLGCSLWVEEGAQSIQPGMSGSPVVLPNGSAVGVVCVGGDLAGPDPLLSAHLPAWLVRDLAAMKARTD